MRASLQQQCTHRSPSRAYTHGSPQSLPRRTMHVGRRSADFKAPCILDNASVDTTSAMRVVDPSPEVIQLWRRAQAVCFDVDSTFCEDESIDEVASFLGVGEEVARMTASAMGGEVDFRDALAARLGIMRPSKQQIEEYLATHPPRLSPGIPELLQVLRAQGKEVFLVSGGFRNIIHPIADSLGIPLTHVYANEILFDEDGAYAGFNEDEFTSRSHGKARAIKEVRAQYGYQVVAMVGDGATDLEARQPDGADIFIGYGGAVYRPGVAASADWYVYKIADLMSPLLHGKE